jgi:hypothetical protein
MIVQLWRPDGRFLRGAKVRRRKYTQIDPTPKMMRAWKRLHDIAPEWAPMMESENG